MAGTPIPNGSKGNLSRPTLTKVYTVETGLLLIVCPPPPEDLTEEASEWWNYYCGILIEGRCLSRMFLTAIHNLCIEHCIRENILLAINETGFMISTYKKASYDDGSEEIIETRTINPLVDKLHKVIMNMDRLLSSLGMTPFTSRANNFDSTGMTAALKADAPPSTAFSPEDQE